MEWTHLHTLLAGGCGLMAAFVLHVRCAVRGYLRARENLGRPDAAAHGLRALRWATWSPGIRPWPRRDDTLSLRAQLLLSAGRPDDAERLCRSLLAKPLGGLGSMRTHLILADALDGQWRVDEALSEIEAALDLARENGADASVVSLAEARMAHLRGDGAEAVRLACRASRLAAEAIRGVQPLAAEAMEWTAKLAELNGEGRRQEAAAAADAVPRSAFSGPMGAPLAAAVARAYALAGRAESTRAICASLEPGPARDWALANAAMAEGDYHRALELARNWGPLERTELAVPALIALGRWEEALALVLPLLPAEERRGGAMQRAARAALLCAAAQIALELGRSSEALQYAERAIKMPSTGRVSRIVANAHAATASAALGNTAGAAGYLARALSARDQTPSRLGRDDAAVHLARAMAACGRCGEALCLLRDVFEQACSAALRAEASFLAGRIHEAAGQSEEARAAYTQAAEAGTTAHVRHAQSLEAIARLACPGPEPGRALEREAAAT